MGDKKKIDFFLLHGFFRGAQPDRPHTPRGLDVDIPSFGVFIIISEKRTFRGSNYFRRHSIGISGAQIFTPCRRKGMKNPECNKEFSELHFARSIPVWDDPFSFPENPIRPASQIVCFQRKLA